MIYNKINIDGELITLCAEEDAEIKVWINGEASFSLPLVYNGHLTITLTLAGLTALENELDSVRYFRNTEVKEVEFEGNDDN